MCLNLAKRDKSKQPFLKKEAFRSIEEKDIYLVEEAKNCILNDLSRLTARIGLPATKAFVLDWVDKMVF